MRTRERRPDFITINEINIPLRFNEVLPYSVRLKHLAESKRKAGILSEVIFWQHVNNFKFHSLNFDRQRIIGNYIVDFHIRKLGLVIEINGSSHNDKIEYDRMRTKYLENLGLKIFTVEDIDVKLRIDLVLEDLEAFIIKHFSEI